MWLLKALGELGYPNLPSAYFCDNAGSIDLSNNPRIGDQTKHIDVAYHYVHELVDNGTLTLIHVPTVDNPADICTKALPLLRFKLTSGNLHWVTIEKRYWNLASGYVSLLTLHYYMSHLPHVFPYY